MAPKINNTNNVEHIYAYGYIDTSLGTKIIKSLLEAEYNTNIDRVIIWMNISVEYSEDAIAIYNMIQSMDTVVDTVCLHQCTDSALLIYMAGQTRYMLQDSYLQVCSDRGQKRIDQLDARIEHCLGEHYYDLLTDTDSDFSQKISADQARGYTMVHHVIDKVSQVFNQSDKKQKVHPACNIYADDVLGQNPVLRKAIADRKLDTSKL